MCNRSLNELIIGLGSCFLVSRDFDGKIFCRDAIVTWIKKKIGPGVANITTVEDGERILTSEDKVILGFLNSLVVCTSLSFFFCYLLSGVEEILYLSFF